MITHIRIKPHWFFTGLAAGFALCCALGWSVGNHDFYKPLPRFNKFINSTSGYFPTLSQMRQVALAQCPPEKILVIVGGDSIFNGYGQSDKTLWTQSLQEKLGDRYCVLNFAFPGSKQPGPALLLAKNLWNSGRKVIFICNTYPFGFYELNLDSQYPYLYWEAYFTGFVNISARDAAAEFDTLSRKPAWMNASIDASREARESSRLDRWLHFRDFWDYVSYRWFSTYWHPVFRNGQRLDFLKPRIAFGDDQWEEQSRDVLEKRWAVEMKVNAGYFESIYASYRSSIGRDTSGRWVESDMSLWNSMDDTVRRYIPEEFKGHTLLVFVPVNPWYRRTLDANMIDILKGAEEVTNRHFVAAGCNTVMNNVAFLPEDFVDYHHLSSSGGEKVAAMVAPGITEEAARLGYLNHEAK